MTYLKNCEKKNDINRFVERCVQIAMRKRYEDPSEIQNLAISSTADELISERRPDRRIDTVVVYFDEATYLTRYNKDLFDKLRMCFVETLGSRKIGRKRMSIVLTDTNASITEFLPHKGARGTSMRDLEDKIERYSLFPNATISVYNLKKDIVRNLQHEGILVSDQQALGLARILHGPPLWFTGFFRTIRDCRRDSIIKGLASVFNMIYSEKIGRLGNKEDENEVYKIWVNILLSDCMGLPNAVNERYLAQRGPFEIAFPGWMGFKESFADARQTGCAVSLAPTREPLTYAACMKKIAELFNGWGDNSIEKLYGAFKDMATARNARTELDTRGTVFEAEFSLMFALGYIYVNKEHFLKLFDEGHEVLTVEEMFPKTSFVKCMEAVRKLYKKCGCEATFNRGTNEDTEVQLMCVEMDKRLERYVYRLMKPGNAYFDAAVGNAVIEMKNDKCAFNRSNTKDKFSGCEDKLRCLVVRGVSKVPKINEENSNQPHYILTIKEAHAKSDEEELAQVLGKMVDTVAGEGWEDSDASQQIYDVIFFCRSLVMFPGRAVSLDVIPEWWRPYVLAFLSPENGYRKKLTPEKLGGDKSGRTLPNKELSHVFSMSNGSGNLGDVSRLRVTASGGGRGRQAHRTRLVEELFRKRVPLDAVFVYDEDNGECSGSLLDVLTVGRPSRKDTSRHEKP